MNRIYISDLDGTLLRNDATLSPYSRETLTRLINDDIKFTVASARNIYSIKEILQDLPLKMPIIGGNGAYITDYKTGKHIVINDIPCGISSEVLEVIRKHNCNPFISCYDGSKNNLYYEKANTYGMKWYLEDRKKAKDKRVKQLSNIEETLKEKIISFIVMDKKENLTELTSYLKESYSGVLEVHVMDNQYSPGWYWLTILDKRATKRQAIKTLVELENLENCETVVFGDNINDIQMFEGADRAIAVENAKKELKGRATEIIGENQNDSVVDFILQDAYEESKKLQEAY
ncbi:HAD family hydrolase [Wukongibacter baidiensis]|uniref:HAD family hydrolase n=1 Tax=Wukongibacter baidiensis TaxID=1723361 RepID=UPI003D7F3D03